MRGHLLASSALISLLPESFWSDLSTEEQRHLDDLYEAKDPSAMEEDELAVKLVKWFEQEKNNTYVIFA
jgi:hypothetical protein